jgi:hypothetical protein
MKCNRRVYAISSQLLQQIMTQDWQASARCVEGAPADAVLVGVAAIYNREVWLVLEHPSFPEADTNWHTYEYERVAARYQRMSGNSEDVSTEGASWAMENLK